MPRLGRRTHQVTFYQQGQSPTGDISDAATVYLDLIPSGTEVYTPATGPVVYTDAATARLTLTPSATEIYTPLVVPSPIPTDGTLTITGDPIIHA